MAAIQEMEMLSMETGLGDSSEEAIEEPHRCTPPWRAIRFLGGAVAVVTVLTLTTSSLDSRTGKARMSGVMQKNSWETSGTFNPETLDPSLQPAQASSPVEDKNDGNSCQDDEEEFMHLCYKKCSILTQGTHRYRTSAFTCCQADSKEKCSLTNQLVNMKICDGLDVSGNINGQESACPHSFGTCYEDEELYLGMCYKKCSVLTNNKYSNRVSPFSCCSATGFSCNPFGFGGNVKSSTDYNVGGKPHAPAHYPVKSITESSSSATVGS